MSKRNKRRRNRALERKLQSKSAAVPERATKPRTSAYKPLPQIWFQHPRDLPLFDFSTIRMMLLDGEVRLALGVRAAPLAGAELGYEEGGQWVPGVQARNPEVAAYVERQWKRLWENHFLDIISNQTWGWCAAEVTDRLSSQNMIEIDKLIFRQSADCKVLVRGGEPSGVQFSRLKDVGKLDIHFPNALFLPHLPDPGEYYGLSVLLGAYSPWYDKWADGGALDVRRLFMHKDAYGGVDMTYPVGTTDMYIDGSGTPTAVPNENIARQIAEQIRAGSVTTRPSERDENGNEKWTLTRAAIPSSPTHILEYPKDLDREIRRAIGIPDDVSDNEGSGAWAGGRIKMASFYATGDSWLSDIAKCITVQLLEERVLKNFGRAEDFQISHKPLAEQAMEQQSNAGPGQPGMPGQDMGMPDANGGLDQQNPYQIPGIAGPSQNGNGKPEDNPFMMSLARTIAGTRNVIRLNSGFDESKHPRGQKDNAGQFAKKPESNGKAKAAVAEPETASSPVASFAAKRFKNPEHAKAFTAWFGDSKVVDENGEPLVVYRGTKGGEAGDKKGQYLFVTTDRKAAAIYAGKKGTVHELFVKAEKPFDVTTKEHAELFKEYLEETGATKDGKWIGRFNATQKSDRGELPSWFEEKRLTDWLKDRGVEFDGMYFGEGYYSSLAIPSVTQIKSATDNQGTFDPNNPNITLGLIRLDAMHAPAGGVHVQGKFYPGGQFIPGEVVQKMTTDELEAVRNPKPKEEPAKAVEAQPAAAKTAEKPKPAQKTVAKPALPFEPAKGLEVKSGKLPGTKYKIVGLDASKRWAKVRLDKSELTEQQRKDVRYNAKRFDINIPVRDLQLLNAPEPMAKPKPAAKPKKKLNEGNFHYDNLDFVAKGAKAKFRDNLDAIRVLKTMELEGRETATDEEKQKLSKYVGWGQFPAAFSYQWKDPETGRTIYNRQYSDWEKERDELTSLVGDEEFASARASTINSHFTSPDIVKAQWEMARKLGFKGGRYLEPAVGGGYYLGLMPTDIAENTATTAIEMDQITGRIAKALYPASNVQISPFQNKPTPDNFYDLVATNVPFSNDVKIADPKYKGMRPNLHDYYFLRSVDTAKPGGMIMHITSAGTMDKLDSRVRDHINKHCELVSAVRFPGDAHKDNAGTEVVTDLIMLRKKHPDIPEALPMSEKVPDEALPKKAGKEGGMFNQGFTGVTVDSLGRLYHWRNGVRVPGPDWSETTEVPDPDGGDPIRVNKYFADNPEQILGQLDRSGSMYAGNMKNVTKTDDYETLLQDSIDRLPDDIAWTDKAKNPVEAEPEPERLEADQRYNEGQLVIKDGQVYQHDNGSLNPIKVNAKDQERLEGMIGIRDKARALMAAHRSGEPVEDAQKALNDAYDEFVAKHGNLHNKLNRRAMREDPDAAFLLSLENYNSTSKKATKADIFSRNTIRRDDRAMSAGDVSEAAGITLHETAHIDIDRIAALTGKDVDAVKADLVSKGIAYENPAGGWEPAAQYLSGNTRRKLAEAKEAAKLDSRYAANVAALEKAQPEDIDREDIGVKLGAPWIPPETIKEFSAEVLGARASDFEIMYVEATNQWYADLGKGVRNRSSNTEAWGVKNDGGNVAVDYQDILRAALSGKALTIRSSYADKNGNHAVLPEATEAANEKVAELKQRFKDWIWEDEERGNSLAKFYNENFNNIVPMKFDGSHQNFPGMNQHMFGLDDFQLRPNQKDFVWRVVTTGKGLAAHEVGTGKTASMVAGAMELRRLGLAKKPAIVVLKKNIGQITQEAQELYPDARILSTADMFSAHKRQQTLNRISTGDYDMIIMTHDHLNAMKMKPETMKQFVQEEIEELTDSILAAAQQEGKMGARVVKQLENQKQKKIEQLKKAFKEESKDSIFFEDTGIDQIFVDEAHYFKNLSVNSSLGQIKGVPSGAGADRAQTMYARARWLQQQHNGRGVVFATGTPISNSMAELFNMQKYLQYDELKERGLHKFDAWASTYGDTTDNFEFKLNGEVEATKRFAEFVNLPELRHMASEMMDVVRADDVKKDDGTPLIKRPDRNDEAVISPEFDAITDMMRDIHRRANDLKGKRPGGKGEDNMLSVCNDSKLGSIDMRLIDKDAPDHPDSKANQAVKKIVEAYHAHPGETQAVFSDVGIHPNKWGFSVFEDMKKKLVAAGIPESEIVNFSQLEGRASDEAQDRMNRGDARIAFGSTKRLGTGVNIQKKLRAIHHLDIPYVPAYIEQRDGRGYRSGNKNKDQKLDIYKYVQQGSADNLFWQIVSNKANFINQYIQGKTGARTMKDLETDTLTPDEMIAISTGDEAMLERVALKDEVRKLKRSYTRHVSDRERQRHLVETAPERQKELEATRDQFAKDAKHFESKPDFDLQIKVKRLGDHPLQSSHDKRADAEPAFDEAIKVAKEHLAGLRSWNRPESVEIGYYKDLPIHVKPDGFLELEGPSGQRYGSGASLKSLEYTARAIEKKRQEAETEIENFKSDVAKMKEAVSAPFRHESVLREKEARLEELDKQRKRRK